MFFFRYLYYGYEPLRPSPVGYGYEGIRPAIGYPLYDKDPSYFWKIHYNMLFNDRPCMEPNPSMEEINKLKDNVELLGGIENTVGTMEGSLNDYELKNLY